MRVRGGHQWILRDLSYGARTLRRNLGFTAIVVLTFALGIGANSAVFTLTYIAMLKSLPVPNPGQLVRYAFRNGPMDFGLSGPAYDALRKHESVNIDLLAWSPVELAAEERGNVVRVNGALLSGNGFRVLELSSFRGRIFDERDDVTGGGPNGYQALISYDYWKEHFSDNQTALGSKLNINKRPVNIIGILPPGFEGLTAGQRADIILPLAFEEVINAPSSTRHQGGVFWLTVIGRLKLGQSLQSAQSNLWSTEAAVREEADPRHEFLSGFFGSFHFGVESGRGGMSLFRIRFGPALLILEALVGLLLVLCCANIALLMMARVSSRLREFAVCGALGAPRSRLLQMVLAEVLLVAACGLGAGLVLGWVAARTLVSMLAGIGEPLPLNVSPQGAIVGFTALITVLSAVGAGLWPAIRASRVDPACGLKEGGQVATSRRLGIWMVPAQVALSLTLLTCASLLGVTLLGLLFEKSGFRTDGVVLAHIDLKANKLTRIQVMRSAQQMLESIQNAPAVEAATILSGTPLSDSWAAGHYFSKGEDGAIRSDMQTWPEFVSPDYFKVMGTRILAGREFTRADENSEQVCILSASASKYFFPKHEALGQFVYDGGGDSSLDGRTPVSPEDTCRVVGVAEDARFRSLRELPPRMLYKLVRQDNLRSGFFVAIRSRSTIIGADDIRSSARRVIPSAVEPTIFSFNELVKMNLRTERVLLSLALCFAAIALLLTALGLYGLLARHVVARTKEIGLRLALGASRQSVERLIIWQGLKLVLVGAAVGIPLTLFVTRPLSSLLFGVHAADPRILAAAVVVLLVVALAACYYPARQAMNLHLMTALRYE